MSMTPAKRRQHYEAERLQWETGLRLCMGKSLLNWQIPLGKTCLRELGCPDKIVIQQFQGPQLVGPSLNTLPGYHSHGWTAQWYRNVSPQTFAIVEILWNTCSRMFVGFAGQNLFGITLLHMFLFRCFNGGQDRKQWIFVYPTRILSIFGNECGHNIQWYIYIYIYVYIYILYMYTYVYI